MRRLLHERRGGSGFQAAILAELCAKVYGLETLDRLADGNAGSQPVPQGRKRPHHHAGHPAVAFAPMIRRKPNKE